MFAFHVLGSAFDHRTKVEKQRLTSEGLPMIKDDFRAGSVFSRDTLNPLRRCAGTLLQAAHRPTFSQSSPITNGSSEDVAPYSCEVIAKTVKSLAKHKPRSMTGDELLEVFPARVLH